LSRITEEAGICSCCRVGRSKFHQKPCLAFSVFFQVQSCGERKRFPLRAADRAEAPVCLFRRTVITPEKMQIFQKKS